MIGRKKSGRPIEADFDAPLIVHALSNIYNALVTDFTDFGGFINQKELSKVSYFFQVYMDDKHGKFSSKPRSITKFPIKLFRDYSCPGSLYIILHGVVAALKENGYKTLDIAKIDKSEVIYKTIKSIESKLIKERYLIYPKIFLTESCRHLANEFTKIVIDHGGSMTQSIDEATHVVEWDEEVDGGLPEEIVEEYIRTIEIRHQNNDESMALVHWWYHPDSYDEWIPGQDVDFTSPPDSAPTAESDRQWHICCRFIRDLEIFNEWGNEVDYEIAKDEEKDEDARTSIGNSPDSRRTKGKTRGRKKAEDLKKKILPPREIQLSNVIPEAVLATEKMQADNPPPSMDSNRDTFKVITLDEPGFCSEETMVTDEVPIPSNDFLNFHKRKSGFNSDSDLSSDRKKRNLLQSSKNTSRSGKPDWYDPNVLSAVEMRYLPEFFDSSSSLRSPASLLEMRLFILSLYEQNPGTYLSATDCRRKLSGDVQAIIRVHEFLDAFGIINNEVKLETRPPGRSLIAPYDSRQLPGLASLIGLSTDHSTVDTEEEHWSSTEDNKLLAAVEKSFPTNTNENFEGIDWQDIAKVFEGKKTAQQCLSRFVSIPLPEETATDCSIGEAAVTKSNFISKDMFASFSRQAIAVLGLEKVSAIMTAVTNLMKSQVGGESKLSTATLSTALALGISAAIQQNLADLRETSVRNEEKSLMAEYVSQRLSALEEKTKLLLSVEKELELERQRLELDRRDLQIQRAQVAFFSQQQR